MRKIVVILTIFFVLVGCGGRNDRKVYDDGDLVVVSARKNVVINSVPYKFCYEISDGFDTNYNDGFLLYTDEVYHVNDTIEINLR